MNAKIEPIYDKNRQPLHNIIPLDTPFTIVLEPTTFCNLKCNFCFHSLSKNEIQKSGHFFAKMNAETFELFINQIKEFPNPIKSIAFVGLGEPLLHEELPNMIRQLKLTGRAKRITVVTNGVLLSPKLTVDLVNSGLDEIKISVNGLSSEDYLKTCGVKIDFEKYISEIAYLYENKKQLKINIKILDSALGDRNEFDFYDMFGNYCDRIIVERVAACHPGVSYKNIISDNKKRSIHEGVDLTPDICSALFYVMLVRASGKIHLCCNTFHAPTNENMYLSRRSLYESWNSEFRQECMLNMLKKNFTGAIDKCKNCQSKYTLAYAEDYLDDFADEIYERIKKLNESKNE